MLQPAAPRCFSRSEILSVTTKTVGKYLKDIDDQLQVEREEKMLAMWLACHTQQDIGDAVGVTKETVSVFLQKCQNLEPLPKSDKSAISDDDTVSAFLQQIRKMEVLPKSEKSAISHDHGLRRISRRKDQPQAGMRCLRAVPRWRTMIGPLASELAWQVGNANRLELKRR